MTASEWLVVAFFVAILVGLHVVDMRDPWRRP